jgi:hypothetical protein
MVSTTAKTVDTGPHRTSPSGGAPPAQRAGTTTAVGRTQVTVRTGTAPHHRRRYSHAATASAQPPAAATAAGHGWVVVHAVGEARSHPARRTAMPATSTATACA